MSKSIIIGLVTVATLLGVAAANAREECKTVRIPTMNCTPTGCFASYTEAQVCKQVPDTPKPSTKLGTSTTAQGTFNATGSKSSGLGARTVTFRR